MSKLLLSTVAVLALMGVSGAANAKMPLPLTCTGVLTSSDTQLDSDAIKLKPEAGSVTWCDSDIEDDIAEPGTRARVLKKCWFGGRCRIRGIVNGHGAFYWVRIQSVESQSLETCYARIYDAAHLAKHPDQLVTAVKLCFHHLADEHKPIGGRERGPDFILTIKQRGKSKTLSTEGLCWVSHLGTQARCDVECDGGGIDVKFLDEDTMSMTLGRIRMQECGKADVDDGSGIEVTGGKDDRVFRLNRVLRERS